MRVPKFERLYKVVWEYYYNFRRKHQKTFEYLKRDVMIEWVANLKQVPVTSKISVYDYEGHCKDFVLRMTETGMQERAKFLTKVKDAFGDESDKFMKGLGDNRVQDLPLSMQANLNYLADRKMLETYIDILDSGESTNTSLYVVAGIPVWRVMQYLSDIRKGERNGVPEDLRLTDYQVRLLKAVGLWSPLLLKREEVSLI